MYKHSSPPQQSHLKVNSGRSFKKTSSYTVSATEQFMSSVLWVSSILLAKDKQDIEESSKKLQKHLKNPMKTWTVVCTILCESCSLDSHNNIFTKSRNKKWIKCQLSTLLDAEVKLSSDLSF